MAKSKKNSKIVDRILKLIELKGMNKSEFYLNVGLSNGFLDKVTNIGSDKIEKILATYPDVRTEWLVLGKGEMLKTDSNNESAKGKSKKQDLSDGNLITLIDSKAVSSLPHQVDNFKYLKELPKFVLPLPQFSHGDYALIELTSDMDSMMPTLHSGDCVFALRMKDYTDIHDGYLYVIVTKEYGVVCKRVLNRIEKKHCLTLQSDNDKYKPYDLPISEILQVWKVEYKISSMLQNNNEDLIKEIDHIKKEMKEMQKVLKLI